MSRLVWFNLFLAASRILTIVEELKPAKQTISISLASTGCSPSPERTSILICWGFVELISRSI